MSVGMTLRKGKKLLSTIGAILLLAPLLQVISMVISTHTGAFSLGNEGVSGKLDILY